MKVAILHHHFDSGGVTSVALAHIAGFARLAPSLRPREVLLMHGGRAAAIENGQLDSLCPELLASHRLVSELEYDERRGTNGFFADDVSLADAIEKGLQAAGFGKDETVIHVHNPTLGKNVSMSPALRRLGQRGWVMLLQIHDFAEDLRPRNYASLIKASERDNPQKFTDWLYPSGPGIHYATLSTRDANLLADRVVRRERVHLVPNPIIASNQPIPDRQQARQLIDRILRIDPQSRYVLYPVRGIQRKNLGEILLLSLMYGRSTTFSVTLPPTTEIELASWRRWIAWSHDLKLPIVFGSGLCADISLAQNRAAADAIVTTSVAEGFGLAYLESWLTERSVVGRDIAGVTNDFRESGIVLDGLYQNIKIPLEFEQKRKAVHAITTAHRKAWSSLPEAFQPASLIQTADPDEHLDFAQLTTEWQYNVLARMASDHGFADACRELNTKVFEQYDASIDTQLIQDNRRHVSINYSPAKIGESLVSIYQTLLQQSRDVESLNCWQEPVIEKLWQVSGFYPLRTECPVTDNAFQRLAKKLEPIATSTQARLDHLRDIKAVIFDIYGTLVISSSGDVGTSDRAPRTQAMSDALHALALKVETSIEVAVDRLHAIIAQHQDRSRTAGIEYPEVDILHVWQQWLDETLPGWRHSDPNVFGATPPLHQRLAEEFEARSNPCYIMPGATEVLRVLSDRGIKLGIVSNAQFFTEKTLSAAFDANLQQLGFEHDLCYFSYRFGHGKPSTVLYEKLAEALSRCSIAASQTLYVGNDMLNDVTAAAKCHFKTAWFAGDQRSLRDREGDPRVSGVSPDLVITQLSQLLNVI